MRRICYDFTVPLKQRISSSLAELFARIARALGGDVSAAAREENAVAIDRVLRALQSGAPLADPARFLAIVRERFDAESCALVRHDFSLGRVFIEKGHAVTRRGLPDGFEWECALAPFEAQLGDLATKGWSELGVEETSAFVEKCAEASGLEPPFAICRHVAVPVVAGGRPWGALSIEFADDRTLSDLDRGNLRGLADVIGAALERRQTYLSLQEAQRLAAGERDMLKTVMNTIPVPCFLKDAEDDFRYVLCNEAFAKLFGMPRSEIEGMTDWDLLQPSAIALVRANDFAAMKFREAYVFESPVFRRSGPTEKMYTNWKKRMSGPDGHVLILTVISYMGEES
jgi:PAS domain-containing protein